ncbi:autotransporter outer membrane beta-barrel domain-containing protein [Sutterella wadsworthensis]|uniref:autotransporter outer membrane beta-barrel domain-containing protein n=1 Tax=Sutterella wadsworthensis TaxID=40545 RepID=UPI0013F67985|nr:autotransporter outer membrane beta-barrel domain-containing protein [Sutterella wadsworthensis]
MNRTFKVAKSLTRGVVVTSEKASSYQGKAVKTVVAAAVAAMMAGAAVADEAAADPTTYAGTVDSIVVDKGDTATITNTTVVTGKTDVKGTLSGNQDVTFEGAAANAGTMNFGSANTLTINGGLDNTGFLKVGEAVLNSTLKTVLNFDEKNHFKFETLTVNEGGALEITKLGETALTAVTTGVTANDKGNYTNLALTFSDGTINLNGGSLAIGTNGVLTAGEGDAAKTYGFVNDKGHLNLAVRAGNAGATINITKGDYVYGDLTLDGTSAKAEANLKGGNLTVDNLTVKGSNAAVNLTKGNAAVTDTLDVQAGTSFKLDGASLTIGKQLTAADGSTFDFKKGVLTNNGAATFSSTSGISLGNGATFDNNGTLSATSLTLSDGAKVSTHINTKGENDKTVDNYSVKETTLNKGSTFELKSLNSNQYLGFGNEKETGKTYENDQFLVTGVWNLNGGDLIYNGSAVEKLKIGKGGENDKTTNVVTIGADYSFGDISFGQNGNLKVTDGNTLTVSNLYLSNGDATFENAGKLVVDKVIIKLKDGVNAIQNTVITNKGAIYTSYDNLFTGKDGKYTEATLFGTALKSDDDTGTTYETAYEGTYTKDQLTKVQNLVGKIVFTKGSMVAADGKNVTVSDVDGVITPNTVADSDAAKVEFKDNTEFGVLNFTGDGAKGDVTVNGTAGKSVTISGAKDGGALFTGVAADKTITVSTGNFVFGDEEKTTSIDRNLTVGASTSVALEGALNTKGITLADSANLAVNGTTVADYVTGGSATVNGALAVSSMYVAPKATAPEIFTVQSNYTVQGDDEQTAVLAFGSDIAKAQEAAADAVARLDGVNSVLYIDKQLNVGSNTISIGGTTRAGGTLVSVGSTGAAVIDLAAYGASSPDKVMGVFADAASGSISNLALTNLSNTALTKNDAGVYELNLGKVTAANVDFGMSDDFYKQPAQDSSVIAFDVNEVKLAAEYGAFNSVGAMKTSLQNVQFGQNALSDKLIFGMEAIYDAYEKSLYQQALAAGLIKADTTEETFKKDYDSVTSQTSFVTDGKLAEYLAFVNQADSAFTSQLVSAEHAATNMAALGGAFTTALDINDQVTAAVSRRTSAQRAEGFTPWVDVFGTTNEAKRLYGNGAGYEADIYGAVLGFDYTAACGGTLGVAFNVGQADGNSVGSGAKVDNDADFYGVSLYGAQTFGDFNVKADLGYTQVSNDLSTNNILGSYKESLDANVFTFGLGTEYLAKFGALNITPHAGIRLSRIDMDDSKYGADYDTMTVYQLPLGVAFSGNFDVNGWKLAPMVDLSVVPAFGDKDAVATYTGGIQSVTRVVDTNPIQATLGVSAQNGAWTFGLNYGLTAGGDDRMNNAFNANLRYSF